MLIFRLSSIHTMSFTVPTYYVHQFFTHDSGPYPGIIQDKDHALLFMQKDKGVHVNPKGHVTQFAAWKGRPRWRVSFPIHGYSPPLGLRAFLMENSGRVSYNTDNTIDLFVSARDDGEDSVDDYQLTLLPPATLVVSKADDKSRSFHFRQSIPVGDEKYYLFCTRDAVIRIRNVRSLYWFLHRGAVHTFYKELMLALKDTVIIHTTDLSAGTLSFNEDTFDLPSELGAAEPGIELSWTLIPVFDITGALARPLQFVLLTRRPQELYVESDCLAYTFTFAFQESEL